MFLRHKLRQEGRRAESKHNSVELVNIWRSVFQLTPQEAHEPVVVLINLDLEIHLGNITGKCNGCLAEANQYLQQVPLQLRASEKLVVQRDLLERC